MEKIGNILSLHMYSSSNDDFNGFTEISEGSSSFMKYSYATETEDISSDTSSHNIPPTLSCR